MASATITLKNLADEDVVYSLVGVTPNGASYKDASRSLQLPRTMDFRFILGAPGSLGNDKISVTFRNSVQNSTTQKIVTVQSKLELSVPRDSAVTATVSGDILAMFQELLTDAKCAIIAGGMVP